MGKGFLPDFFFDLFTFEPMLVCGVE